MSLRGSVFVQSDCLSGPELHDFVMLVRIGLIFLLSLGYAILRYNIFGNVSPENIPSYVANKALAAGSAIALLIAAKQYVGRRDQSPQWCLISFGFAVPHVF